MSAAGPTPTQSPSLAVDYVLTGDRSAAAVARGDSQLVGAAITASGSTQLVPTGNLVAVLNQYRSHRIYHDLALGLTIEHRFGIPQAARYDDTRIMSRLLDETCVGDLTGEGVRDTQARWPDQDRHASINRSNLVNRLFSELPPRLDAEQLTQVYRYIELPVVAPTVAMMTTGMRVDVQCVRQVAEDSASRAASAQNEIVRQAGYPVNASSHDDTCHLLYGRLGLPVLARTGKGNPATTETALRQLAGRHSLIAPLREHRRCTPIRVAAEAILEFVRAGRIYPELDAIGASTGRFSCRNPPLQALPSLLMQGFVADQGCTLIEADYSQIELRVLAHISGDQNLRWAFQHDADVHRSTAARILGIAEHAVTSEQRDLGKQVNFGVIYGQSEYGLAEELNIPVPQAKQFIGAFFAAFPAIRLWREGVVQQAIEQGFVSSWFGRRRRFRNRVDAQTLRQAVNFVVQGTAADLLKLAIVRIYHQLPPNWRLLFTRHDSVLLLVPEVERSEAEVVVRRALEQPVCDFAVPLPVSVKSGRSWDQCQ